jgi:hypothetical protein
MKKSPVATDTYIKIHSSVLLCYKSVNKKSYTDNGAEAFHLGIIAVLLLRKGQQGKGMDATYRELVITIRLIANCPPFGTTSTSTRYVFVLSKSWWNTRFSPGKCVV